MADDREVVVVRQCWGCNRLRAPLPWASPAMLSLLRSEGRLRVEEDLCGKAECPAWAIAGGQPPSTKAMTTTGAAS